MSHSYKKHPITKDGNRRKRPYKQLANRRVRRFSDMHCSKSMLYKRVYNSWDICDYLCYWSKEDAIQAWLHEEQYCCLHNIDISTFGWHKEYGTLENFLQRAWRKQISK